MTYSEELEKQAKRGFEYFMIYIDEHSHLLTEVDEEDGDTVVVNQLGSSSTIFRSSNEYVFEDDTIIDTENTENTQNTENTEAEQ